jgi:pimeloyl-ACP methyl ester carboxylesterase
MDWWEDGFCERLAAGRRFVVRYDLRDTGQSITYPPGAPEYDGIDLVADAVGVLDAFGIARAHVAGISMGGGIAQLVALDHPARVASLALFSTSPGGAGSDNPDLPPMSDQLAASFRQPPPDPDWTDRGAVVDYVVEDLRNYTGSHPFDEERLRALAGRVFDRTIDIASTMKNHGVIGGGGPLRPRLEEIATSTLVLHGTEDPLFPFGHAEALAAEIPAARLMALDRVGHEHPPPVLWDQVVADLLDHTAER